MRRSEATFNVWHDMTLYLGQTPEAAAHSHYPIEIVVPLEGKLLHAEVEGSRLTTETGVVVRSGARHWVEPGIPAVVFLIGACTPHGLRLRPILGGRDAVTIPPLATEPLRELIADRKEESWSRVSAAWADCESLFGRPLAPAIVAPRLMTALDYVEARARDEVLSLDDLAASVATSPSHLSALFRGQAELSFRQYRRWIRLWMALLAALDGMRLRDAAHEVGFADQAHLTRTCQASFGLPPAALVGLGSASWPTSRALARALAESSEDGPPAEAPGSSMRLG
jgi:AraC-like DNA-binding protein